MVTAEQAATDFNKWLARKHATRGRNGIHVPDNFAKLTEMINEFRVSYYRSIPSAQVPEVFEIEAVVRKKWRLKAAVTRKARAAAKKRREATEAEKARQYELPL